MMRIGIAANHGERKLKVRLPAALKAAAKATRFTYLKRDIPRGEHPRPNVVLLDLNLPRVDGHSVLATIKADPELRSIPVVVLTTSQEPDDKAKAYSCHANSYLAKPTDFGEFSRMVKDLSLYWSVWNQQLD
jgi:CheY-like chemotaxis protein